MSNLLEIFIYLVLIGITIFLLRKIKPLPKRPPQYPVRFHAAKKAGLGLLLILGPVLVLTLSLMTLGADPQPAEGDPSSQTASGYAFMFSLMVFGGVWAGLGIVPFAIAHLLCGAYLARSRMRTASICNLACLFIPIVNVIVLLLAYMALSAGNA